jgi:uncharacterized protein YjbJ (UPF0337 family)
MYGSVQTCAFVWPKLTSQMSSNRTEANWKQLAGSVKRRLGELVDQQVDLWSGKRERAKQVAEGQVRQQQSEPPK